MNQSKKQILLIDLDDPRRDTRVRILMDGGYAVEVRKDHGTSEMLDHEAYFDLVLLSLSRERFKDALAYSNRIAKIRPTLPILLLTDAGVFVPRGTLSRAMETGHPKEMLAEIAEMLVGSKHIREIET